MSDPHLAADIGGRFEHVLVDEYQDTNRLQASILLALKPEGRGLTVVGDDAQSIYSFRAATVRNNKFLAKLASDHRKPDGLFVITPKMGPAFVEALPVGKFHGVGPATTAKMNRLGIQTGLDLRAQSMPFLQGHFGKAGAFYYWIARGVDDRPVLADRIRKSVGAENTFSVDLFTFEDARDALAPIIDKVWRYCESSGTRGRTATLKIKYADFQQITRSHSVHGVIDGRTALEEICLALLKAQYPMTKGIRLLGISLSALRSADTVAAEQLPLGL
jgi:DNA polymerase-4